MLFVRKKDILSTMVGIPIVVVGLILVALSAPIQQSFASSRTLDFTIYPDGSTHVFYELDVDPLELEVLIELFGEMIENITIIDEDGFLLSNEIDRNLAVIEFNISILSPRISFLSNVQDNTIFVLLAFSSFFFKVDLIVSINLLI